jgi:hypothetical protein
MLPINKGEPKGIPGRKPEAVMLPVTKNEPDVATMLVRKR